MVLVSSVANFFLKKGLPQALLSCIVLCCICIIRGCLILCMWEVCGCCSYIATVLVRLVCLGHRNAYFLIDQPET